MKTNNEIDKIRLKLNEQLEEARLSELRLDTLNQMAVCENESGHKWEVYSHEGELTSLHNAKLWCKNCPCWVNLYNHPLAERSESPINISFNGKSQTLTSWLEGDEIGVDHQHERFIAAGEEE